MDSLEIMVQVQDSKTNIKSISSLLEAKDLGGRVIALHARGYPATFYQYLVRYVAGRLQKSLYCLAADSVEEVIASLSVSFLGQSLFYFIPDVSVFSAASRKKLEFFLSTYSGEHCVFLSSSERSWEPGAAFQMINIPEKLDIALANRLVRSFFPQVTEIALFEKPVLTADFIQFALAFLIKGSIEPRFFQQYCTRVGSQDHSIFLLAQFWLAKRATEFGQLWVQMVGDYPTEYWVSFYSDLLWQALYCVQNQGVALDRALSNRLPFSFSRSDWRVYSVREIAAAHAYLYNFDWQNKNGCSAPYLDLFLIRFLSGGFAR